jgi:hypothetical protein
MSTTKITISLPEKVYKAAQAQTKKRAKRTGRKENLSEYIQDAIIRDNPDVFAEKAA